MIPRHTFPRHVQAAIEAVNKTLKDMKIPVDAARLRNLPEGQAGWRFMKGSARIDIYVVQGSNGRDYLQILSPLMHLPSGSLLPLYRRLLELNMSLSGAAFGVDKDLIYLFVDRPLQGLGPTEIAALIAQLPSYADRFDDELLSEYGGRRYGQPN